MSANQMRQSRRYARKMAAQQEQAEHDAKVEAWTQVLHASGYDQHGWQQQPIDPSASAPSPSRDEQ